MPKEKAPSAHNYYLDMLYNFGFISLLPMISLIVYSILRLAKKLRNGLCGTEFLVLAGLVMFYVFLDNFFKVSFRQPYPGIIMFFLWGVLLQKLSDHNLKVPNLSA